MVVIGRGFNFATAHEIALKLQESAYVMALAFSSADFRHGPLSLVEPGLPALVIAPSGQVQDELLALANAKGLNPDRPRRLQKITATH